MKAITINPNHIPDIRSRERASLERFTASLQIEEGAEPAEEFVFAGLPDAAPKPVQATRQSSDADAGKSPVQSKSREGAGGAMPSRTAVEVKPRPQSILPEGIHPLITSIFASVPRAGTAWSADDRANWMMAAESIFRLVYRTEGKLQIEVDES